MNYFKKRDVNLSDRLGSARASRSRDPAKYLFTRIRESLIYTYARALGSYLRLQLPSNYHSRLARAVFAQLPVPNDHFLRGRETVSALRIPANRIEMKTAEPLIDIIHCTSREGKRKSNILYNGGNFSRSGCCC